MYPACDVLCNGPERTGQDDWVQKAKNALQAKNGLDKPVYVNQASGLAGMAVPRDARNNYEAYLENMASGPMPRKRQRRNSSSASSSSGTGTGSGTSSSSTGTGKGASSSSTTKPTVPDDDDDDLFQSQMIAALSASMEPESQIQQLSNPPS